MKRSSAWVLPFLWIICVPLLTVPPTALLMMQILEPIYFRAIGWVTFLPGACTEVGRLDLGGGVVFQKNCPMALVLLAHGFGVLNLVPALWLRSSSHLVKAAAAVATTFGAVRLIVPMLSYLAYSWESGLPTVAKVETFWLIFFYPRDMPPSLQSASMILWFVSVLATIPFGIWATRQEREKA
jgi:hypothetical protein